MNPEIINVLMGIDPRVDENWTADGQVRIEIVRKAANSFSITRDQVDQAAPSFDRAAAFADWENRGLITQDPTPPTPHEHPGLTSEEATKVVDDLEAARKNVAILFAAYEEARKAYEDANAELDVLISQKEKAEAAAPHAEVDTIQRYLKSQREVRAARAKSKAERVVKADTRSAIDKSLNSRPRA